jgi:uncharacterized protein (DUF1778 family)
MKRDKRIEVRVTPEELAILKQAADREGATLSSWVRMILLRHECLMRVRTTSTSPQPQE